MNNVKKFRSQLDISQDQLSSISGVSQAQISLLETGKTGVSLEKARLIADALKQELKKVFP